MFKRLDVFLFFSALAATCCLALTLEHFPYSDINNHLARFVWLDRYMFGHRPDFVLFHWIPTPYIGLDVVGVALVHLFSPEIAQRLLALLALAALPLGMFVFIQALNISNRGWALIGVLLSLNWCFLYGFVHYSIGLGAAFFFLAYWWPRRERPTLRHCLGALFGASLVYCIHLSAALTMLTVIGFHAVYVLARMVWIEKASCLSAIKHPRWALSCIAIIPVLALFAISKAMTPESTLVDHHEWVFRPFMNKLQSLFSIFYAFDLKQAMVLFVGYGVSLLALGIQTYRRRTQLNDFIGLPVVFLALYAVFPVVALGGYDVDMRFLLPAFLFPFCVVGQKSRNDMASNHAALFVPWIACFIHLIVIFQHGKEVDRSLDDYNTLLSKIPAQTSVLALVVQEPYRRLNPYRHYVHWHAIRNSGKTGQLFCGNCGSGEQLSHFTLKKPLYAPDIHWGTQHVQPLDWKRIQDDYDYVVLAGVNADASTILETHAKRVHQVGHFSLYIHSTPKGY